MVGVGGRGVGHVRRDVGGRPAVERAAAAGPDPPQRPTTTGVSSGEHARRGTPTGCRQPKFAPESRRRMPVPARAAAVIAAACATTSGKPSHSGCSVGRVRRREVPAASTAVSAERDHQRPSRRAAPPGGCPAGPARRARRAARRPTASRGHRSPGRPSEHVPARSAAASSRAAAARPRTASDAAPWWRPGRHASRAAAAPGWRRSGMATHAAGRGPGSRPRTAATSATTATTSASSQADGHERGQQREPQRGAPGGPARAGPASCARPEEQRGVRQPGQHQGAGDRAEPALLHGAR